MRALVTSVCLLWVCLAVGCGQRQQFPQMQFAVTDSLLGPAQRDLSIGVRYRAPKAWLQAKSAPQGAPSWINALQTPGDSLIYWSDSLGQSGMVMRAMAQVPDSVLQALIDHPERFFAQTQAVTTTYRHGTMVIVQQALNDSTWSGFHLLGMEGTAERFSLMLYCPRQLFGQTTRTWESVIGSLDPVGAKQ